MVLCDNPRLLDGCDLNSSNSAETNKEEELIEKLKNKEGAIGVIGLGYVRLPLAVGKRFDAIELDAQSQAD